VSWVVVVVVHHCRCPKAVGRVARRSHHLKMRAFIGHIVIILLRKKWQYKICMTKLIRANFSKIVATHHNKYFVSNSSVTKNFLPFLVSRCRIPCTSKLAFIPQRFFPSLCTWRIWIVKLT
jgi:hypothetical protein